MSTQICGVLLLALSAVVSIAKADEATVAVASNFIDAARQLESSYETGSGREITIVAGSTGKLYAQISQGAPFDIFLAADSERPGRLEELGLAERGTRFTYALGRLSLWSSRSSNIAVNGQSVVLPERLSAFAIANPRLAPYGLASRQALENLGLWSAVEDRIVLGENVSQAFTFVATENAELGLVALSQVLSPRNSMSRIHWLVPATLHAPIRQDAVLLRHGHNNIVAQEFMVFLKSTGARDTIRSFGYEVE